MIVVIETLSAVQGKGDELKNALLELIPISRTAKGCIQYDLLGPVDHRNEFLVLMRWEKLTDLREHEASDYIAELTYRIEDIAEVWEELEWRLGVTLDKSVLD